MDAELAAAVEHCRDHGLNLGPTTAIILGSGLGGLADEIGEPRTLATADIPGFARGTAAGHRGQLVAGRWGGSDVLVLAGRLHRYEGWSLAQITFPVRLLAALGARSLIVSNAAGGLRAHFRVGDPLVIRDHINWIGNPPSGSDTGGRGILLRGTSPYDPQLAAAALAAGRRGDFAVHEGTYLATLGPTYETRAEYRMMRRMGADCVGMSTVPEVLEARRLGMRVLAISMISNVARPDAAGETTHEEVLEAGRQAEPRMKRLVHGVLQSITL